MNAGEVATESIKIGGGNYNAIDTQDGYVTVKDVPLMGEVEKGEKNAPKKIGHDWHQKAVEDALARHVNDKYTAPAHIGHNDPINKAEFAGFGLPKKVSSMTVNGKEQSVVIGDMKMKKSAFERAKKGELPYISVEVSDWNEPRISSVSFLDTKPPFFEFPLFTIGEVKVDPQAKFEAKLEKGIAEKFAMDEKKPDDKTTKEETKCCGHCSEHDGALAKLSKAMGMSYGGKMDEITKPSATPVEQDKTKMQGHEDPKVAAQLALFQDKIARLEAKDADRDREAAAIKLEAKAMEDLKGYMVGEKVKAQIAKFARVGEKELAELLAAVKESSVKYPPSSLESYEAASMDRSDPVLAKFQTKGPDSVERAAKFLAEWKILKKNVPAYSLTAEQHVEMSMKNETTKEVL